MLKRTLAFMAIVAAICAGMPTQLMSQSKEEGTRLFNEAKRIEERARSSEDLRKAVAKYRQALRIFEKVRFDKGVGWVANNLGLLYEGSAQYSQAIESYEKSLGIKRKLRDLKGEGITLNNLGIVYRSQGQYRKAVEFYEKSLAITRKARDLKTEGMVLNNLGMVYADWGQYEKAVESYEKSLKICKKLRDFRGEGMTLNNLGIVYKAWGRYPKAVEIYEKSLAMTRKVGDVRTEGMTLNNLGALYSDCGQYAKAVRLYKKSLAIRTRLADLKGQGVTLMGLGVVYNAWGQYAKAVYFYEKSLTLTRKVSNAKVEGITLNNLGEVYSHSGQHSKALEFYEKSLAIRRHLGDRNGEGMTLSNIGMIFAQKGEFKSALASFEKALSINQEIGVPINLPKKLIGNLYLDQGNAAGARSLLKEAGHESSLGRLHLMQANYQDAKSCYQSLVNSAEKNRSAENLFTGHTGLGTVFEGLGDDLKAEEHYSKAVQLTEEIRGSFNRSEREQFFDVRIEGFYRTEPYKGLARVLTRMNKPAEAFQRSEYTKARVFAEALSRSLEGKALDVPEDVLREDSALTDQLAALKKARQQGYEKDNREVVAAVYPLVRKLESKMADHVKALREKYPLFAATKYPEPMEMSRTALKPNEWVLAYDVSDSGLLTYLTRGKEVVIARFNPVARKALDRLVRKFRTAVEVGPGEDILDKTKSFDIASGKKLSDLLLGDVLSELPKSDPVIVIPDGPLGVLPFEMLVLNEGGKVNTDKPIPYVTGAEFFGDRNPISYYQSVTALTLARTLGKQQKAGDRALAMVDPVFSPDDTRLLKAAAEKRRAALDKLTGEKLMSFKSELALEIPRLPHTTQLGESLKKADPEKTDLYVGMEAQKSQLFQADLSVYRSLVFATHGYFGKDLPGIQEPVLILTLPNQPQGQDGFLRMSEVTGLKLNADMVALTACQSGLGRMISGEGTMGMGRAFQYAGAKSVLMSLWSVADRSSVLLTESFFKHLRKGKNKLEALKLARDEIRKAGYDHPFFWAPFILVGEID